MIRPTNTLDGGFSCSALHSCAYPLALKSGVLDPPPFCFLRFCFFLVFLFFFLQRQSGKREGVFPWQIGCCKQETFHFVVTCPLYDEEKKKKKRGEKKNKMVIKKRKKEKIEKFFQYQKNK